MDSKALNLTKRSEDADFKTLPLLRWVNSWQQPCRAKSRHPNAAANHETHTFILLLKQASPLRLSQKGNIINESAKE
jgi:hypothetical protein